MTFQNQYDRLYRDLSYQPIIHTGEWQSMDTRRSQYHGTRELLNVTERVHVSYHVAQWQAVTTPDLPWAEDHFQERVSGIPYNPPPSHETWPHRVRGNGDHIHGGKFDHTYPERFWPRHAGECHEPYAYGPDGGIQAVDRHGQGDMTPVCTGRQGIRFDYGDLNDVVKTLARSPLTRQAYLPVWFPEDTGPTAGRRVPCTLGYHFMLRNGALNMTYFLRSCDLIRHYRNDVYMAGRLLQWVCHELNKQTLDEFGIESGPDTGRWMPGWLTMHIVSLHMFEMDRRKIDDASIS